jgi:Tfp pilus assembly protein PilN
MSQVNSSMNFLPEDYVEKRQAARAAVVFIGLLLLVVGGIVGSYLYKQWTMKGIFAEHDRVNAAFDDASKQIAKAQELEKQKEDMARKFEITATLMERVRRSDLLTELTNQLPKGVRFVGFDLKAGEAKGPSEVDRMRAAASGKPLPPKTPPSDIALELVGTAPTDGEVAAYMTALQKSPLLVNVTLLYSEEFKKDKDKDKDAVNVRRFCVAMHINPSADLRGVGANVVTAMPEN